MISTAFRAVLLVLLLGTSGALAERVSDAADHQALRALKHDVLKAINSRNLASMDALLNKPFLATVLTQESFNDPRKLRGWFEGLFTRPVLRLTLQMSADADEQAQIYQGTFAVARGSTNERYELGDGRGFDIQGRWTATAIKQNGRWRVVAVHSGTNFLDNPVINAIERHSLNLALGGAAAGVFLGGLVGFFLARRRYKVA